MSNTVEIQLGEKTIGVEMLDYTVQDGRLALEQQGCREEINSAGRLQYVCPPGQQPELPTAISTPIPTPPQVGGGPLPTPDNQWVAVQPQQSLPQGDQSLSETDLGAAIVVGGLFIAAVIWVTYEGKQRIDHARKKDTEEQK